MFVVAISSLCLGCESAFSLSRLCVDQQCFAYKVAGRYVFDAHDGVVMASELYVLACVVLSGLSTVLGVFFLCIYLNPPACGKACAILFLFVMCTVSKRCDCYCSGKKML